MTKSSKTRVANRTGGINISDQEFLEPPTLTPGGVWSGRSVAQLPFNWISLCLQGSGYECGSSWCHGRSQFNPRLVSGEGQCAFDFRFYVR